MKYKNIIAPVLALTLLAVPFITNAEKFDDTRGHWAETVIDRLAAADVVHGISDTQFNPDGTVTRAEFLKMALGAVKIEDVPYREGECLDVAPSEWYGGCVQSALDKGLIPEGMIDGYAVQVIGENETKAVYKGSFNGSIPIKREEMAYLVQSVYQYSLDAEDLDKLDFAGDLPFEDVSTISIWAYDGVSQAFANDFIAGMGDGTFAPQQTATRAQAAVIISKLLDK